MSRNRDLSQNIYDFLSESQYWPVEQLRAYQLQQLEQLLRHAKANAPFYASRLDVLFRRGGAIAWDRWTDVPVLKRADVLGARDAMLARELPPGHGNTRDYSSSGTTGHPVSVRHVGLSAAVWRAAMWRAQKWHGTDWSTALTYWLDPKHGVAPRDPEVSLGPWGPPGEAAAAHGKTFTVSRHLPAAARLDHLRRQNAAYLSAPCNIAFAAALDAERAGDKASMSAVFSSTMAVEPEHREAVSRVFGAAIRSLYSSIEVGQIGHSCSTGPHFHLAAEFALLEILDAEDQPCAVGQPGRIVVTPFLNSAQPLIRYDLGDIGIAGGPCACGCNLPVLAEVSGRIYTMFHYPGGRMDMPKVPDALRRELRAITWQFAQVRPDTVEVRYLPEGSPDPAAEASVAPKIAFHLNADFRIIFRPIAEIPLLPSGKYLKYVCELPRDPPP